MTTLTLKGTLMLWRAYDSMPLLRTMAVAAALAFAIATVAPAPEASAQTAQVTSPAKKPVKRKVVRPRGGQVACTPAGCRTIPPNCRPQTGYTWDGDPSGFDIVVCR